MRSGSQEIEERKKSTDTQKSAKNTSKQLPREE